MDPAPVQQWNRRREQICSRGNLRFSELHDNSIYFEQLGSFLINGFYLYEGPIIFQSQTRVQGNLKKEKGQKLKQVIN